jgi:RNA polymerase sigma factor (TIGR02999 family)
MPHRPEAITDLIASWRAGDGAASEKLFARVYGELKRLARRQLRDERPDHTLQPTALVHEAYLRLSRSPAVAWQSREHFFRIAGRAMREVLIDHARTHRRQKRGSGTVRVQLQQVGLLLAEQPAALLALGEALAELSRLDPAKAAVVELHFFGGFSVAETGRILECSSATVTRHWRLAKAWLAREVRRQGRA